MSIRAHESLGTAEERQKNMSVEAALTPSIVRAQPRIPALGRSVKGGTLALALVTIICLTSAPRLIAQEETNRPQQSPVNPSSTSELPESPGTTLARLQSSEVTGQSPNGNIQKGDQVQNSPSNQAQPSASSQAAQKPVGTAAAEPTGANGVAASQPAGVAIASGKQRRVRTIVISVVAIAAAGVAIGSVAALTAGTASRPPGAH